MIRTLNTHLPLWPALALTIAACDEAPPSVAEFAQVRVLHASPDAPQLDLYAGPPSSRGQLVSNNLAYGNATSFQAIGVGSEALVLTRAGAPYDQLYGIQLELKKGDKIDLVAAGEVDGGLHVVMLHENATLPDAGTVRLRVVNASPDATPMGLDFGDDGTVELSDLALFDDSGEQGLEIPSAQSQEIGIIVAGRTIDRFTLPGLPEGGDNLLVLTGYAGVESRGLSLLAPGLGLLQPDPSVYFAHLVGLPNVPGSLDVYVGSRVVAVDLQFGDMVRIGSSALSGAVACPHGQPRRSSTCFRIGAVAYSFNPQAGHSYLVLVHFKVEDFLSTFFDASFDFLPADAQLHFIEAAGCCTVDVGQIVDGQYVLFDGYSPVGLLDGAVSSGPVLSAGNHTLGFRFTGDPTVYAFETVLNPDSRSFAVWTGPHLYLIDTSTEPWSRTVLSPLP